MNPLSKILIFVGILLITIGIIYHYFGASIPFGKLPGDFKIKNGNSTFYFPLATCLIISGILSLISWFFKK